MFLQHFADGILSGAIVALGAIGLSFTMKILRFANFSHAELLTWGAYTALIFLAFFSAMGGGDRPDYRTVIVRFAAFVRNGVFLCRNCGDCPCTASFRV